MDLPSWARVGAKVVCVDDVDHRETRYLHKDWVSAGQTYIIREVYFDGGLPGFLLVGVKGHINPVCGLEQGYAISRFRPLVDQQTDIATHFAHHLKQPEKV